MLASGVGRSHFPAKGEGHRVSILGQLCVLCTGVRMQPQLPRSHFLAGSWLGNLSGTLGHWVRGLLTGGLEH